MTTFLEFGQVVLDRRATQGVRGIRSERHRWKLHVSTACFAPMPVRDVRACSGPVTKSHVFRVKRASIRARGVSQIYVAHMAKAIDMTGQQIGRLTVLSFAGTRRKPCGVSTRLYSVRCSCGTEKVVDASALRGKIVSCGCARRERWMRERTRHGLRRSPEYAVWCAMKRRCSAQIDRAYANYGGRGIRVCDEWQASFAAFIADVGPRPSPQHSIDRIDNDGNYEPGNVRWATRSQQNANQRRSRANRKAS